MTNNWQDKLDPLQYEVARLGATEQAFTGKYWDHKEQGTYVCVCCDTALFSSDAKYDSGSGWPSFYDALDQKTVTIKTDNSHGMSRDEATCTSCGSHLGHLFTDGPAPTGLRYCVNSASLDFKGAI